jgi:hypothetical protein
VRSGPQLRNSPARNGSHLELTPGPALLLLRDDITVARTTLIPFHLYPVSAFIPSQLNNYYYKIITHREGVLHARANQLGGRAVGVQECEADASTQQRADQVVSC